MISLALVFPTMAGFGGTISGPFFDLKSNLLQLFIKGLHYFYVTNFILFLVSLQQFLNYKTRKEKKFEKGLIGVIQKSKGYWFYIIYFTISANYFTWLGSKMGSVPGFFNQSLLSFNMGLFTLLSLPIVNIVARYLSSEVMNKMVPPDITDKLNIHTGCKYVFYGIYGFIILTTTAYIWHWDMYFHKIEVFFSFMGTRFTTVTLLVFLSYALSHSIKRAINAVINARSTADKKQRKNNRLYSFLVMIKSVLPALIWIPVAIVSLILFGLNGKFVFYSFAGIIAVLVFIAQNVVQDIVKGLILVFEDRLAPGDFVSIDGITGIVENMTLDSVTLKDLDKVHHIISYGRIGNISNISEKATSIKFNIKISKPTEVDNTLNLLKKIGKDLPKNSEVSQFIVEDLDVLGIESFDGQGISIGICVLVASIKIDSVKSILFRKILDEFQERKIDISCYPS
jgi:small conductance mechanosensitive channel